MRLKLPAKATECGPPAWRTLKGELPPPGDPADRDDVLWQEFGALFRWYDSAATSTRRAYQTTKVISLVVAAAVPVLAATSAPAAVTAAVAAIVVVTEGLQQLFQLPTNRVSYRSTAEAFRLHAFLYVAQADPYADPRTRRDLLAEFMREAATRENTGWSNTMRRSAVTSSTPT